MYTHIMLDRQSSVKFNWMGFSLKIGTINATAGWWTWVTISRICSQEQFILNRECQLTVPKFLPVYNVGTKMGEQHTLHRKGKRDTSGALQDFCCKKCVKYTVYCVPDTWQHCQLSRTPIHRQAFQPGIADLPVGTQSHIHYSIFAVTCLHSYTVL